MIRALTIALVLTFAAVGLLVFKWRAWSSDTNEFYFCTRCGLEKHVTSSRIGPVAYHRTARSVSTEVSRVIGTNDCSHHWSLYRASRDDRASGDVIATKFPADWEVIPDLLRDPLFASDLGRMEGRKEKWQLLVQCLSTNVELGRSFSEWRQALPYRSSSSWWRQSLLGKTNSP